MFLETCHDYSLTVSQSEDKQFSLLLCNDLGTPVDSRHIDIGLCLSACAFVNICLTNRTTLCLYITHSYCRGNQEHDLHMALSHFVTAGIIWSCLHNFMQRTWRKRNFAPRRWDTIRRSRLHHRLSKKLKDGSYLSIGNFKVSCVSRKPLIQSVACVLRTEALLWLVRSHDH